MTRRLLILLSGIVLVLGTAACQQVAERPAAEAELEFMTAEFTDAVPLEYGQLVSVTPLRERPYTALMWFKKPNEEIVVVRVNVAKGTLSREVLTVPRR